MIKLENITKTYGKYYGRTTAALNGISVTFGDRGLVFVLGKSGSGKSTLLNLIGGIDKPTSGEIIVDGRAVSGFKPSELDGYRNTSVGFVFQEYNLLPEYSVGKNIGLAIELQGKKAERERIEQALREVGLVDNEGNTLYERRINELSGGQKQRVAVARALIKDPRVILADEPTGALDVETGEALYELLKELARDRLVIVVTHDVDAANKYGDRKIKLADGKIAADTKEGEEEQAECEAKEPVEYKRGKLPVKRAFFMGLKSFRNRKIRLGVSIFISSFMCFIVGLAFTAATIDKTNVQLASIYENGMSYVILESNAWSYEALFDDYYVQYHYRPGPITDKQKIALKNHFDSVMPAMLRDNRTGSRDWPECVYNFSRRSFEPNTRSSFVGYTAMVSSRIDALIELNSESGEKAASLSPDPRFLDKSLCRLPRSYSEIAISDAKYDMFAYFGYKDNEGNDYILSTPDDLIGKKIGDLTIVGIYSTDESRESLLKFNRTIEVKEKDFNKILTLARSVHTVNFGFVKEGYFAYRYAEEAASSSEIGAKSLLDERIAYYVKLSGNRFLDKLFLESSDIKYESSGDESLSGKYRELQIVSSFSTIIDSQISTFTSSAFSLVTYIVGGVFIIISVLLVGTYINISLQMRNREIGVLRALGASKKDVFLVCFFESLIIGAVIFIMALIESLVACHFINDYYYMPLFMFGITSLSILFAICFGMVMLATAIPLAKVVKRSPVEIINNSMSVF